MGRVANRIAKGLFVVDGVQYKLDINNGPNAIHGGLQGFNKVSPEVEVTIRSSGKRTMRNAVFTFPAPLFSMFHFSVTQL